MGKDEKNLIQKWISYFWFLVIINNRSNNGYGKGGDRRRKKHSKALNQSNPGCNTQFS